jgi:bifunctional DNA-binding transcriptional regulator/antitoxin component of YhaV-PrlF toxin-antitoxin module
MLKKLTKINELGMIEIPQLMCLELGLKEKTKVMVYAKYGTVFLKKGSGIVGATTKTLDEFNRVLIPAEIRESAQIPKNCTVHICLTNGQMHIEHLDESLEV